MTLASVFAFQAYLFPLGGLINPLCTRISAVRVFLFGLWIANSWANKSCKYMCTGWSTRFCQLCKKRKRASKLCSAETFSQFQHRSKSQEREKRCQKQRSYKRIQDDFQFFLRTHLWVSWNPCGMWFGRLGSTKRFAISWWMKGTNAESCCFFPTRKKSFEVQINHAKALQGLNLKRKHRAHQDRGKFPAGYMVV